MLYVVATPIGNLGDITLRAIEVLKSADAVAAEDTRYSGVLLKHFGIKKPLVSFHEHNEAMRTAQLIERLAAGENIALVTDAGMPGLSDPGGRLIRECIRRDLPFTIVPGPSSILTAIVGSGFSTEKFFFAGFLPVKSGGRERELRGAALRDETTVFFESPYRLMKTLSAAIDILQDRQLCVARELTKKFEEFRRGSAAELLAHYQAHPPKGEIVLLGPRSGGFQAAELIKTAVGNRRPLKKTLPTESAAATSAWTCDLGASVPRCAAFSPERTHPYGFCNHQDRWPAVSRRGRRHDRCRFAGRRGR